MTKPNKSEIREFIRNAKEDLQRLLAALTADNGRQVQLFLDASLANLEEAAALADERYELEEEEEEDEEIEAIVHYECETCETEWTGDGTEDESVCSFCEEEGEIVEAESEEED